LWRRMCPNFIRNIRITINTRLLRTLRQNGTNHAMGYRSRDNTGPMPGQAQPRNVRSATRPQPTLTGRQARVRSRAIATSGPFAPERHIRHRTPPEHKRHCTNKHPILGRLHKQYTAGIASERVSPRHLDRGAEATFTPMRRYSRISFTSVRRTGKLNGP